MSPYSFGVAGIGMIHGPVLGTAPGEAPIEPNQFYPALPGFTVMLEAPPAPAAPRAWSDYAIYHLRDPLANDPGNWNYQKAAFDRAKIENDNRWTNPRAQRPLPPQGAVVTKSLFNRSAQTVVPV